jgi:hypothetical protein
VTPIEMFAHAVAWEAVNYRMTVPRDCARLTEDGSPPSMFLAALRLDPGCIPTDAHGIPTRVAVDEFAEWRINHKERPAWARMKGER